MRIVCCILALIALTAAVAFPQPAQAITRPRASHLHATIQGNTLGVQQFLDQQPGVLKTYQDGNRSAAAIIEGNSLYYGLSPYLVLALLETQASLLSDPNPPDSTLQQPFGSAGPVGFAAQIEWASRELRAGLGPYDQPPVLLFTDGATVSLSLDQAPEGIAMQRFMAQGRTEAEWQDLNARFATVAANSFQGQLDDLLQDKPTPPPAVQMPGTSNSPSSATFSDGFLYMPWPDGIPVVHLAYFDHTYPTVDSIPDGNALVMTYLGEAPVQYNTHDGHDYYFPDQPIGTPILATAPGLAYAHSSPGNGVVILHENGYETVYWHLDTFDARFNGLVDVAQGVWVQTGDVLGTSGSTGFVVGTPHLHFEVRHNGRQVDPYGWFGYGPDPCAAYAGCAASTWLWHDSLRGKYDFTPPTLQFGASGFPVPHVPPADFNGTQLDPGGSNLLALAHQDGPPVGTLTINPPDDILFQVPFDGHVLQQVGHGVPIVEGPIGFEAGFSPQAGQSLKLLHRGGVSYPLANNLDVTAGTIALWAKLPDEYVTNGIQHHYLFAASATPVDEDEIYTGTLALRRELLTDDNEGSAARWNFWTTPQDGGWLQRDDLSVPDTLASGWHHFAVTWDSTERRKALYIDGQRVASTVDVNLPDNLGEVLQLGRFTYGDSQSGIVLDELVIYDRLLGEDEIAELASLQEPLPVNATIVHSPTLLLDTNASDLEGGIMAMRLGRDGTLGDPVPYYDAFGWQLPYIEGTYTLSAQYFDTADNTAQVTHTVTLDLPPRGDGRFIEIHQEQMAATVALTATDLQEPIEMQLSATADFTSTLDVWEPFTPFVTWEWTSWPAEATSSDPPSLWVRFRDGNGQVSAPIAVSGPNQQVYLPGVDLYGPPVATGNEVPQAIPTEIPQPTPTVGDASVAEDDYVPGMLRPFYLPVIQFAPEEE